MVKPDKQKIKHCFTTALPSYTKQAVIQQEIQQRLINYWQYYNLPDQMECILEIGCGTGGLTQLLQQTIYAKQWYLNDLCDTRTYIAPLLEQQNYIFSCEDAEHSLWLKQLSFLDVIVSASVIQWFHEPERFIQHCTKALKQEGYLVLSTFSPNNLSEIVQLTGVGLDYVSIEQWQKWLEQDFEILLLKEQMIPCYFSSPIDVLRHLQQTGVNGIGNYHWTKGRLSQFQQDYRILFKVENQGVSLTYSPIFIIAKKKG
ncbi:malonyl-ACP O-methyltransferase BioC [Pelistega ratti]|uniref:malonyl-ACP O-methyltransferase BioC n=1 Tax=Pelistega ratti TaxID=2652177 RepID=UPI00135A0CB0|nr:malonyl-ACP O-methyltransferase BioC [Pelistega ratti]